MEIEMKRLVQQAEGFPPNVRNIELKYSLADWELARTKDGCKKILKFLGIPKFVPKF